MAIQIIKSFFDQIGSTYSRWVDKPKNNYELTDHEFDRHSSFVIDDLQDDDSQASGQYMPSNRGYEFNPDDIPDNPTQPNDYCSSDNDDKYI